MLGAWLGASKVKLDTPKAAKVFVSSHPLMSQVDRSAPWVVFSLLIANLIGSPNLFLPESAAQVMVIFMLMLVMRFCYLGAGVLAITLAWSGWDISAVMLLLVAAPFMNVKQLARLNSMQSLIFMLMLFVGLLVSQAVLTPQFEHLILPRWLNISALIILLVLYALSLLRLGPRAFMRQLLAIQPKGHHH